MCKTVHGVKVECEQHKLIARIETQSLLPNDYLIIPDMLKYGGACEAVIMGLLDRMPDDMAEAVRDVLEMIQQKFPRSPKLRTLVPKIELEAIVVQQESRLKN